MEVLKKRDSYVFKIEQVMMSDCLIFVQHLFIRFEKFHPVLRELYNELSVYVYMHMINLILGTIMRVSYNTFISFKVSGIIYGIVS